MPLATQRRTRNFSLRTSIAPSLRERRRTSNPTGGARRDRTDDLLLAKQALSQLSYGPELMTGWSPPSLKSSAWQPSHQKACRAEAPEARRLVGLGRFELPTSRLSSARSNQLSYKPLILTNGRTHRGSLSTTFRHGLVREEREA